DYHVRKAIMPMGFYGLIPPLVLSKSVLLLLLNLLNCKHRMRFSAMLAEEYILIDISLISCSPG
ncbi:hypothetical protein CAP36_00005, partial [Chitinophagaceae bacterium IBVUCB2]